MLSRGSLYTFMSSYTETACLTRWRSELLAQVAGDVLEIGPGTGLNLRHYRDIESLHLLEPNPSMRSILTDHLAKSSLDQSRVHVMEGCSEAIPLDDESVDTVVGTLVLCSVNDVALSLSEIHRVLKPNGVYVFLEHVGAVPEHTPRRRWQNRLTPIWKRVMNNCHLNRDTEQQIISHFNVTSITRESMKKVPPIFRPSIRGVAEKSVAVK